MLSLELPMELEQQLRDVVQKNFQGNVRKAFTSLLMLHSKYGWKEQLAEDVETVRCSVRDGGGVNAGTITDAIAGYRKRKST